jgi:hypothetical protein
LIYFISNLEGSSIFTSLITSMLFPIENMSLKYNDT